MADRDRLLAEALEGAHQKGYSEGYDKGLADAKLALKEAHQQELRELRDLLSRASAITNSLSQTSAFDTVPAAAAGNPQTGAVNVEQEPSAGAPTQIHEYTLIDALDLSARVFNVLTREGIQTIGQLVSRKSDQLLDYRVFGQGSLQEVRTKLAKLGLYLADEKPADETQAQLDKENHGLVICD